VPTKYKCTNLLKSACSLPHSIPIANKIKYFSLSSKGDAANAERDLD